MAKYKITKQKLKELENELEERVNNRSEIKSELMYAAEQGDFVRENFPYDAAKEKYGFNENRIERIKNILKDYEI
ncbi:MAG: hypothetical protein Q9M91_06625 [Candidatus Dojkabacteria bacterium]|nr:hypothetical protein [Candidatus Dojkabacteria bacterium]MDQ7021470.1 hypothetical protein [Candidatus Dojkabacteria bacterium]